MATARNGLQELLNSKVNRGHSLNLRFGPQKAELMDLIAMTSKLYPNLDT